MAWFVQVHTSVFRSTVSFCERTMFFSLKIISLLFFSAKTEHKICHINSEITSALPVLNKHKISSVWLRSICNTQC